MPRIFRLLCCYVFLFPWYVAQPDLHSFPTRRSSDLICHRNAAATASLCTDRIRVRSVCIRTAAVFRNTGFAAAGPGRSEEHTSELQSHSDLVCRLLLEKKKEGGWRRLRRRGRKGRAT